MSSTSKLGTGLTVPTDVFMRAPNYVNGQALGASSANTVEIPAGAQFVRLACNGDLFVTFGSTGVSTAGSTAGAASELVPREAPLLRSIGSTLGTTALSIMSTAIAHATMSWWTVN